MDNVYQHSTAIVETQNIGSGSRIWAFVHILPGAIIGVDANICDHVFIENDVTIGDRVTIKCGVQIWDGVHIEDNVFVGPNATFTNDLFPRSKQYPERFLTTRINRNASIGANATILAGVTVGMYAMVGAGAVVTRDVPPHAIVVGNPARIKGYVSTSQQETIPQKVDLRTTPEAKISVAGVYFVDLPRVKDLRGNLLFGEINTHLPFQPQRLFLIYGVPSKEVRGEHAHRTLEEMLICVQGSCSVVLYDGTNRAEFDLNDPQRALYIPPMIWSIQYKYSPDAILLVLASHKYDVDDYIRDFDEFEYLRRGIS